MARPRRKVLDRFLSKIQINPEPGCWDWVGNKHRKGYGFMKIDKVNRMAHRISFELFRGKIPAGLLVCHSCDNPSCVNPHHLFIGTNTDNMNDMIAKGRQGKLRGSAHGRAKLTESDVLSIRSAGIARRALAERYGVSKASIDDICSGRSWKHLMEGAQNG